MQDVVIIGSGPAGLSAALYILRGGFSVTVIGKDNGALEKAEKIENYFGLDHPLSGHELIENGRKQVLDLGGTLLQDEVVGISWNGNYLVSTASTQIETRAIILTTGTSRKTLKIKNLSQLEGHGVSYCAVCDAFFYRGKEVAVVGNGDFALHEAEQLRNVTQDVTIYTDGKKPEFSREHPISVNTMKIQAIEGEDKVSGLLMQSDASVQEAETQVKSFYPADGVFIALGTAGSTEIARQMGAEITDKGNIKINEEMETTIPGLFAAGDCTGGLLQVSKAVYEGSMAAISAGKYVRSKKSS